MRFGVCVRPLGPPLTGLDSQESLCSAETYFVEAYLEELELTDLQESLRKYEHFCLAKGASVSRLEAQVSTLKTQAEVLTARVGVLEELANYVYSFKDENRFSDVGMQMSIRSFVDHILSAVYIRAGLVGMNANTGLPYTDSYLADWLRGVEATLFFQGGHSVILFKVDVALDLAFLSHLRSLRSISSTISRKVVHTSKPILVAAALSNLLYKEDDIIAQIFRRLFQYSFTDVVNKHETGYLTNEEAVRLKKKFSSQRYHLTTLKSLSRV